MLIKLFRRFLFKILPASTIRRLEYLDKIKRALHHWECKIRLVGHHPNNQGAYKECLEECKDEFNAHKYWWMKGEK